MLARLPRGGAAAPTSASTPFDLFSLFLVVQLHSLYTSNVASACIHTSTLLQRAFSEINYSILGLLCSPGKVELYLQCNKIQRQAVQKEKPVLALGIGGEMLWRRAASLAVLIGLKDEPRRPCFPLQASMWST